MMRDLKKDAYGADDAAAPADISLKDRDQEIQFGAGDENEADPADREVLRKKPGVLPDEKDDLQTIEKDEDAKFDSKKEGLLGDKN